METPIHQERQTLSRVFFLFVIFIIAGCVLLSVMMVKGERIFDTIFLVIMGIAILILLLSMVMRVVVTSTELRFGFPFWRVRLPLEEIEIIGRFRGKETPSHRFRQPASSVQRPENSHNISLINSSPRQIP
jgi:hypothetical protein